MYSLVSNFRRQLLSFQGAAAVRRLTGSPMLFKPHVQKASPGASRSRSTYARTPIYLDKTDDIRALSNVEAVTMMGSNLDFAGKSLLSVVASQEPDVDVHRMMYPGTLSFYYENVDVVDQIYDLLNYTIQGTKRKATSRVAALGCVNQGGLVGGHAIAVLVEANRVTGKIHVAIWDPMGSPNYSDDQAVVNTFRSIDLGSKSNYAIVASTLTDMCPGQKCMQYYHDSQQCYLYCTWFILAWCAIGGCAFPSHGRQQLRLVMQDAGIIPDSATRNVTDSSTFFQVTMFALSRLIVQAGKSTSGEIHDHVRYAIGLISPMDNLASRLRLEFGIPSLPDLPDLPWVTGNRVGSMTNQQFNMSMDNSTRMPGVKPFQHLRRLRVRSLSGS